MKVIIVFFCIFGLSFAALDIPEHLRKPLQIMRKACIGETGVDEKYIEQSKNGYLPDVPELRCYVKCLFEHSGMMEEDGTIHIQKILHLLPPSHLESLTAATTTCQTIRGDTRCDTAYLTLKCFYDLLPEGAVLP